MSRVLTMGWENRCQHPQMISFFQTNCEGAVSYPVGGVEGLGFMKTDPIAIVNTYSHAVAAKYDLLDQDDEIFLDLDFRLEEAILPAYIISNRATITWDNEGTTDPGRVEFDAHTDMVYWDWSGESGSTGWVIQPGIWYTVDLRVKAVLGGNDEIELLIDGRPVFSISQDVGCAFTAIDQIWLGAYDNLSVPFDDVQDAHFDNVKVNTAQGDSPDNTWPWHKVLIGLPLVGPGTYTQLDPTPGPPNWQNVDDLFPDDDDYNQITQKDTKDTYHFTDLPLLVLGSDYWEATRFILRNRHRVAVPTGEGWTPTIRVSSADYDGTPEASGSAFFCFEMIWETNPATGLPWEKLVMDTMEAGAKSHD